MQKKMALVLVLAMVVSAAAQSYENTRYFSSATPGKKKGDTINGELRFNHGDQVITFAKDGKPIVSIPYSSVKTMLYERASKPRYAAGLLIAWPLMFTKSKKHYLTIQYTDTSGKGAFMLVQLDKDNFREALATAEAELSKKVERSEEG